MKEVTYLIVGGGMTAASAVSGIRELDKHGTIAILSSENQPPYNRPPLSKKLWTGKKKLEDIWRDLPDDVAFHAGRTAVNLDLDRKVVTDDTGEQYRFEKLLLATGGSPRRLPFGGDNIIYYRDLNSYRRLRGLAAEHDRFVVIGGGFIGSEIAAALAMQGKQVTMLFPEDGIGARIFPVELASFLNEYYGEKGVNVLAGESVTGLEGSGTDLTVLTESGRLISANGVVAGIGITPNVALAETAGLEVGNGIVVNGSLQTSHPDVYAAGDVASFPDPYLDRRRRVEHEDAANSMGRVAGQAMAGGDSTYDYSPMFYSDMFDLGYEAVGRLDSRLETDVAWEEPFHKGVITYIDEGKVAGVLNWNVWDQVDQARERLGQPVSAATRAATEG